MNDFEPRHAFRLGGCAWGLQFHPEYDGNIMRSYILAQADDLEAAGRQVSALVEAVRETPAAAGILRAFAKIAQSGPCG